MLKLTRGFTSGLPCRLPRGVGRGKAHTTERFGRYERLAPPSLREGVGHIPRVALPPHIPLPPYGETGEPPTWPDAIPILGEAEAERMRKAGALAKATLQYARSLVAPGITTADIDARVHAFIINHGAYPSPLNYMGFPKSICTSISNVLCHGIPDTRSLCSGDLINIDITVSFVQEY
jgi:methionyl aminopeptidase